MVNAIHSNLDSIALPASPSNASLYSFEMPDGGMFIFIKFPCHYLPLTSEELFKQLAASGVIIVPGDDFHVCGVDVDPALPPSKQEVTLRLTYAASQPEAIRDGIARLSRGVQNILTSLKENP
jgi:DNA-binding transcriptional MocR family regulator